MCWFYSVFRFFSLIILSTSVNATTLPVDKIELPPGFTISVYSSEVPGARSLKLGKNGVVFVSTRGQGHIYALLPNQDLTKAKQVKVIASNLELPNGIAYKDGSLYVAEVSRILRFDNVDDLSTISKPEIIRDDLPNETHHGWRYIDIGPDNQLYIAIGIPCNVCLPEGDDRFATISRMSLEGKSMEVFARGVRNSVGFSWHPESDTLWFTDNGRDWMGDDLPPDELNHAPKAGLHFGFPYVHGDDIEDPEFFDQAPKDLQFIKPVQNLGPHVASLGMRFYTGNQFPADYKHQIFIAEHGSWNRSKKIGYQVSLVTIDDNHKATSYKPFATGWMENEAVWGRPVDVLVMPDGALLVSDDHAGAVYRISYDAD